MPGSVQSIERAAAVLRLLGRSEERLGCSDIARSLGLAKGTAYGILRTLQEVGFVQQDRPTGKYHLGDGLSQLTAPHLDANLLRSLALNWTDSLAARSGETVLLGVLHGGAVLVAHHGFRPDDTEQTLEVGRTRPAHADALGKVLLAHDAVAAGKQLKQRLASFTPSTIVDPRRLTAHLAQVRRDGWALDVDEQAMGIAGLAAPIRDRGGLTVGAVGVSGPVDRVCDGSRRPLPALLLQVQVTAEAISREVATQA